MSVENPNPQIYDVAPEYLPISTDDSAYEPFDRAEVFEMIRRIRDPEHDLTLEQLHVVQLDEIFVDNEKSLIKVCFKPTIKMCGLAPLIGLSIRIKLLRSLPPRFKVDIYVSSGSHDAEADLNKQLNDKERVCAALENPAIKNVARVCLAKA